MDSFSAKFIFQIRIKQSVIKLKQNIQKLRFHRIIQIGFDSFLLKQKPGKIEEFLSTTVVCWEK